MNGNDMTEETGPTIDINTGIVKGEVISFQLLGKEIEKLNTDNEEMIIRDINCYRHPLYERFLPQETGKQTGDEERRNIVSPNRGKMDRIRNTAFRTLGLVLTGSSLPVIAAACTTTPVVAVAPALDIDLIQKETATPTEVIDHEATATAQAVEQEEARQAEKEEILKGTDTSFTYQQLDEYLVNHGTGWEGGVEAWMEYYRGSSATFKYFFVRDIYKDSGVCLSDTPFLYTKISMEEKNNFPTPKVSDNEMLEKITEAIYIDLYPKNNNGRDRLWNDDDIYEVVVYLSEEMCADGVLRLIPHLDKGGYWIYDEKGKPKYISPEEAEGYNFSDEELELIKQRYTTLIHLPYKGVIGAGKVENDLP